jgi:hypothetical protein
MTFANISALTAGSALNELSTVLGYYSPGDGGGGDLYWDTSSGPGNNGTIFPIGTGRWIRVETNLFNVKWFGAKGDNVHDDTSAVQDCINTAPRGKIVFFPKGTYKVTAQINLKTGQTYMGERGDYGVFNSDIPTVLDFTGATGNIHCLNYDSATAPTASGGTGPNIENLALNCGTALTGIRYYSSTYSNCFRPTIRNVNIQLTEIADPTQSCIWWDPVYLGTIEKCSLRGGRIGVKLIACFMNRLINITTQQGIANNGNPPVAAFYTRQIRAGQSTGSFIGGRIVIETCEPLIIYPDANSVMIDTDGGLILKDTALEINNGGATGQTAKALLWMHKDGTQSPFRGDIIVQGGFIYNSAAASGSGNGRALYGILVEAGSFNRIVANAVQFRDNPITITDATGAGLALPGTDFQRVDVQGSDFASASFTEYAGWKPSTTYAVGQTVQNGLNIYVVATAGISDVSGGPTGTGTGITDGTVVWDFVKENTGPFPLKRYRETNPDIYIVGDPRGVKDNQLIGANGSSERLGAAWGYFKATVDPASFSDNNVSLKLRFDNQPPYTTPLKAIVVLRRIATGTAAGRLSIQCSTNGGTNLVGRWDLSNIPLNEDRRYVITGFSIPASFPLTDFSAWFRANANVSLWDSIAVRSIRVERATSFSGFITIADAATSAAVTSARFKSEDVTEISAGNFLLPASAVISLGTPLITAGTITAYTGTAYISTRTNAGFTISLSTAPGTGNTVTIPFTITY